MKTPTEFTPRQVADYLNVTDADPDIHNLSVIDTAIQVIGIRESDHEEYDRDIVEAAVENLLQWMNDYGIEIEDFISRVDDALA